MLFGWRRLVENRDLGTKKNPLEKGILSQRFLRQNLLPAFSLLVGPPPLSLEKVVAYVCLNLHYHHLLDV